MNYNLLGVVLESHGGYQTLLKMHKYLSTAPQVALDSW